jgi:hypothetical protein
MTGKMAKRMGGGVGATVGAAPSSGASAAHGDRLGYVGDVSPRREAERGLRDGHRGDR